MNTSLGVAAVVSGKEFRAHRVLEPDATAVLDALRDLAMDTKRRFPGPSPASMERADFDRVRGREYVVCEKTDGCRFALVCLTHKPPGAPGALRVAALVDRKLAVHLLPLRRVPNALFQGTVIDGELAWDKAAGRFAFVAFDAVAVAGVPVGHAGLDDRLRALRAGLWAYRSDDADPAVVEVKKFLPAGAGEAAVRAHLDAVARRFDVDGAVFTPVRDPVEYGRAMNVLKLKTRHTVDFVVRGGALHVFARNEPGGHLKVGRLAGAPPPDGAIVECSHAGRGDPRCDLWFLVAVREDKATANDALTFDKTLQNMRENVSLAEALAAFTSFTAPCTSAPPRPAG